MDSGGPRVLVFTFSGTGLHMPDQGHPFLPAFVPPRSPLHAVISRGLIDMSNVFHRAWRHHHRALANLQPLLFCLH
ncbi:hypothetical protein CC2G_011250 [Coprinopsis cinerea AmutBmut pab1-1]|nr:hypothetical protein CC2G_011250 [Coprinopsis cinerea AmutBmut pab1-1]